MQFSLDTNSANYIIRAYTPLELIVTPPQDMAHDVKRIQDPRFGNQPVALELITSTSLIMPRQLVKDWTNIPYDEITAEELAKVQQYQPEIVLLGSGTSLKWPAQGVRESLMAQGIGVEVMDSGAACRTYNILVEEQRHVVAIVFL
ncbi:MAG: hypothetical protein COB61_009050 [Thiotrichales bacterium]|nr:hypothetical protein [Thiotrichales bacterium]